MKPEVARPEYVGEKLAKMKDHESSVRDLLAKAAALGQPQGSKNVGALLGMLSDIEKRRYELQLSMRGIAPPVIPDVMIGAELDKAVQDRRIPESACPRWRAQIAARGSEAVIELRALRPLPAWVITGRNP